MTILPVDLMFYTPKVGDIIIEITNNTVAGVTKNLPSRVTVGQIVTIKDGTGLAGTNNITIKDPQGNLIDGAATLIINTNYGHNSVYWNGTAWRVVV